MPGTRRHSRVPVCPDNLQYTIFPIDLIIKKHHPKNCALSNTLIVHYKGDLDGEKSGNQANQVQ